MFAVKTKSIWIVGCGAVALGVALSVWLHNPPASQQRIPERTPIQPAPDRGVAELPDVGTSPATAVDDRVAEGRAWLPADPDAVDPSRVPAYYEDVEGAALVSLAGEMWLWAAGDRLVITVPQTGAAYPSVIDRVVTSLGDNRSYVGRLMAGEQAHAFVITVGSRNAFANINTPQGSYELVGNAEFGWLMPAANMDQHVDYTKPDYYLPGERSDGDS